MRRLKFVSGERLKAEDVEEIMMGVEDADGYINYKSMVFYVPPEIVTFQ